MAEPLLTTEQRGTMLAMIVMGFTLAEFLDRHPDWPRDAVTQSWNKMEAEVKSTTLKSGQYWAIPPA